SLRSFAKGILYSESELRKHVAALHQKGLPAYSTKPRGYPLALKPWKDKALVRYIMRLNISCFPSLKDMLVNAANNM
ncbi:hypothetical protein M406DRAFT_241858, partial [Cryphonectria parasitica EP155]